MALGHLLLIALVGASSAQEAWPFSMWRTAGLKLRKAFNPTENLPKFYHTTSQITSELDELAGSCKGLKLEKKSVGKNTVDVVRFDPNEKATHRTMVVAGEHARELIGAETALDFVKELCKGTEQTKAAVKDTEFMIILNANPGSRMKVEDGEFCLRVNPKGVDINRNWDTEWNAVGSMDANPDTNPGPKAWSEPETRLLRDLMHEFKPHTFLDVHSGNLGMYLPNKLSDARPHAKEVQKMLIDINEKNCQCPLGMANEEVGYQTCGSSLDYSYAKVGSRFAMAMEVWVDPSRMTELRETWSSQKNLLQTPSAGSSFLEVLPTKPMFIESEAHSDSIENELQKKGPGFCFGFFNPDEKSQYDRTVSKWTTTLLELTAAARNVPERPKQLLNLKQLPMDEAEETTQHFPLPVKIGAGMLFVLLLGFGASKIMGARKTIEAEPLVQRAMGQIQVHD